MPTATAGACFPHLRDVLSSTCPAEADGEDLAKERAALLKEHGVKDEEGAFISSSKLDAVAAHLQRLHQCVSLVACTASLDLS